MKEVLNDTIFSLVKEEATNLLKFARVKELSKLNFNSLDGSVRTSCVYGQMTGNCDGSRALDLVRSAARRVYNSHITPKTSINGLNGSPIERQRLDFWSPIEVFIEQPENKTNGNNEQLIKFLKGERKTLRFVK